MGRSLSQTAVGVDPNVINDAWYCIPTSFAGAGADSGSARRELEGCEPLLQPHSTAARAVPLSADSFIRPREVCKPRYSVVDSGDAIDLSDVVLWGGFPVHA